MSITRDRTVGRDDRRGLPWGPNDTAVLVLLNLMGATVALGAAWASSVAEGLSARVGWANLAVTGLLIAGTGNMLWFLGGRRAITSRRAATATRIDILVGSPLLGASDDSRDAAAVSPGVVSAPGMTRYHRRDCLLAARKDGREATRADHHRAGRRPCEICRPDAAS